MEYEKFLKVITKQKMLDDRIKQAYDLDIDLINFFDGYSDMVSILISEIYGEAGSDWYSWFCYESDYGEKDWGAHSKKRLDENGMWETIEPGSKVHGATDEMGNPICYDFKSLWEYLEQSKTK